METLETITELSHEFGTAGYVRGGGGNTSCKDGQTLWIKPSGLAVADLSPDKFVAVDRDRLAMLYDVEPPFDPVVRQLLVTQTMADAVRDTSRGKPSVETPLHSLLSATYVVHTHPLLVNGMTCSRQSEAASGRLFPRSLWIPYAAPGYELCIQVRAGIDRYKAEYGTEPSVIFLQNHGVIVAANTANDIRAIYAELMEVIEDQYAKAGVEVEMPKFADANQQRVEAVKVLLSESIGKEQDVFVVGCGLFDYLEKPISPDHIIYCKSFPFVGQPDANAVCAFRDQHGYWPGVIVWDNIVCGVGETVNKAELALELAQANSHIKQLARAFGGIVYLSDEDREYIEGWRGQAYRNK